MSGVRGTDGPGVQRGERPRPPQARCPVCAEVPTCPNRVPVGQRCARCTPAVPVGASAEDRARAAWVQAPVLQADQGGE